MFIKNLVLYFLRIFFNLNTVVLDEKRPGTLFISWSGYSFPKRSIPIKEAESLFKWKSEDPKLTSSSFAMAATRTLSDTRSLSDSLLFIVSRLSF